MNKVRLSGQRKGKALCGFTIRGPAHPECGSLAGQRGSIDGRGGKNSENE
jgi:hypothetical protein